MVRKSLDYHEIARRGLIVDATGTPFIDVKGRRFDVIDRAVQKAREEMQAREDNVAIDLIPVEPLPEEAKPAYDTDIDVITVLTEEDEKELNASLWTMWIISFTNLAESDEEIKGEIKSLERLVGTGYYDDEAGDLLMRQVIVYLRGKLSKDKK